MPKLVSENLPRKQQQMLAVQDVSSFHHLDLKSQQLRYFVTHGRLLVAMSAFVEQTLVNAVDISLFAILLPVFIIGGLLGRRVHGFKKNNKEVIRGWLF